MVEDFFIRKKIGSKGDALGVTFPKDILEFMLLANQDYVKIIPQVSDDGKHKLIIEKDTASVVK